MTHRCVGSHSVGRENGSWRRGKRSPSLDPRNAAVCRDGLRGAWRTPPASFENGATTTGTRWRAITCARSRPWSPRCLQVSRRRRRASWRAALSARRTTRSTALGCSEGCWLAGVFDCHKNGVDLAPLPVHTAAATTVALLVCVAAPLMM